MACSFTYGGTSVTFSRKPDVGDWTKIRKWLSPMSMAGGGENYYVSDKSLVREIHTLVWKDMPAADWTNLQTFLTAVNGAENAFTYVDPDDDSHANARIWNPAGILVSPAYYGRYEVRIELIITP